MRTAKTDAQADLSLRWAHIRVPTHRIEQNSLTFPWHKFKFTWRYWHQKLSMKYTPSHQDQTSKLLHDWNVKFPDNSLIFWQYFMFPWQIKNSLTLKKIKFPWHFPDAYEPWHMPFCLFCHEVAHLGNPQLILDQHDRYKANCSNKFRVFCCCYFLLCQNLQKKCKSTKFQRQYKYADLLFLR